MENAELIKARWMQPRREASKLSRFPGHLATETWSSKPQNFRECSAAQRSTTIFFSV